MAIGAGGGGDESLDALRRRVYAPGARPEDVERYAAAVVASRREVPAAGIAAVGDVVPGAGPTARGGPPIGIGQPMPAPRRLPVRAVLIAGGGAAALVGVIAAAALSTGGHRSAAAPAAPRPAATATMAADGSSWTITFGRSTSGTAASGTGSASTAARRSASTGAVPGALPDAFALPATPSESLPVDGIGTAVFVRALDSRGTAGITAYLSAHPGSRPAGVSAARLRAATETAGSGAGTIDLDPAPGGRDDGGRMTLVFTTDVDARLRWTAERLVLHADRTVHLRAVAAGGSDQAAGMLTSAQIPYSAGSRPLRLTVAAPDGVRWDVAVVTAARSAHG